MTAKSPKKPQEARRLDLVLRQERAKAALLAGKSHAEAAREAGVRPEQISRWLAEGGFRDDVQRSAQEVVTEVLGILRAGAGAAARTLVALAEEGDRQAAADILDRVGAIKGASLKVETPQDPGDLVRRAKEILKDLGEIDDD